MLLFSTDSFSALLNTLFVKIYLPDLEFSDNSANRKQAKDEIKQ